MIDDENFLMKEDVLPYGVDVLKIADFKLPD